MFPEQQQPGGQPPQTPYIPPQPTPATQPQQTANGQYAVVPPPIPTQNNGHSGHNPYEFIVSPNSPRQPSLLGSASTLSFPVKIGFLVASAILLIILIAMISSIFGPKNNTAALIEIVQRQQEIVRISTAATKLAVTEDAQNFVANTSLSVASSQQDMLAYLAGHGTKKLKAQILAADQDADTDKLLSNAASAGNYDAVVASTLSTELTEYAHLLQTTYQQSHQKELKTVLNSAYNSAAALVKQSKASDTGS